MIPNIETWWDEYAKTVYPNGMYPNQAEECKQAFMAGILTCLNEVSKIAENPSEDDGVNQLASIEKQLAFYHETRIKILRGPNKPGPGSN